MSGVFEKTESLGGGLEDIKFQNLISRKNFWRAWRVFSRGKWRQWAVQKFWLNLEAELTQLYHDLSNGQYRHGPYRHFILQDTKRRDIYVASVRDRLVHQVIADYLERRFAPVFITHSYAAQKGKGVSAARAYILKTIDQMKTNHRLWVGKLDVAKYFANIDHDLLIKLLRRRVSDDQILELCSVIIRSFGQEGRGLPLGNLTSQWFANIYLHELDWHVKQTLGVRWYMRYNDDMMLLGINKSSLRAWLDEIRRFAETVLKLKIPPTKTSLVALPDVVDILGLCTDGTRRWIRPKTVAKATQSFFLKYQRQAPELLDTICSYNGSGIIYRYYD